jgi:hypothetical protein
MEQGYSHNATKRYNWRNPPKHFYQNEAKLWRGEVGKSLKLLNLKWFAKMQ